jgi:hypothetical protein
VLRDRRRAPTHLLALLLLGCIQLPSEPTSESSGGTGTGSGGGGAVGGGSIPSVATGFLGQWNGSLSGTPLLLQIWGSETQPQAAVTVGAGPRESLRVMGIAEGPPRALYMYRGQDDAMFSLVRLDQGRWLLEMWEDGCAREIGIASWSPTVTNASLGIDLRSTPSSLFNGSYAGTLSLGLSFAIGVSVNGSARSATGNFGLGTEALVVLGQAVGPPTALYLWRQQDHATISVQATSSGRRISYWETGCARTADTR